MMTFIAVCIGLITLELGVVVVFLVVTLLKINRTAQAVEVLAYRIDHEVSEFGSTMRSGWMRTASTIANLAGTWWSGRRR